MRLTKKRHPMQPPYSLGDVFAVQIASDVWGYLRMMEGMGIQVAAVFTHAPGLPEVGWNSLALQKWLFYFHCEVRPGDPLIVPVGNVPFPSEADAIMPPTYRDPDNAEPRYTIEERGRYRYTLDPADLKGILKQVTLITATLGSFLKEQFHNGNLREVRVAKPLG
jgi:hypothetical protein